MIPVTVTYPAAPEIGEPERTWSWEAPGPTIQDALNQTWRAFNVVAEDDPHLARQARSMMIGDLISVDDQVYVVDSNGFTALTPDEVTAYQARSMRARILGHTATHKETRTMTSKAPKTAPKTARKPAKVVAPNTPELDDGAITTAKQVVASAKHRKGKAPAATTAAPVPNPFEAQGIRIRVGVLSYGPTHHRGRLEIKTPAISYYKLVPGFKGDTKEAAKAAAIAYRETIYRSGELPPRQDRITGPRGR